MAVVRASLGSFRALSDVDVDKPASMSRNGTVDAAIAVVPRWTSLSLF
jgi:hypothetical protein